MNSDTSSSSDSGSGGSSDKFPLLDPNQGGGSTNPKPIGVPYWVVKQDPITGAPVYKIDSNGASVPVLERWYATRKAPFDINTMDTSPGRGGLLVHSGYQQMGDQKVLPQYYDGAQWLPGGLPTDQVVDLQRRLVQAGVLAQKDVHLGKWDQKSVDAYVQILTAANEAGTDAATALSHWSDLTTAAGPPQLQTQVSDPAELKKVFQAAVVNTLGQGWSDDQLNQLVSTFQAQERAAQINAQTGVSGTAAPSGVTGETAFAEQAARAQDTTGAQAHDALGYEKQFFSALRGVV